VLRFLGSRVSRRRSFVLLAQHYFDLKVILVFERQFMSLIAMIHLQVAMRARPSISTRVALTVWPC
jgi:hypothetical protein